MPTLSAAVLSDFTIRLFLAAGTTAKEAAVVTRGLVGANLRGHDSHGVMRAPQYIDFLHKGEYQSGVDLIINHETEAVVVADGQWGFGQVQAHRLLDRTIPKAKAMGLAAGAARRFGHTGRLGEYAERAADEGLILLATVNNDGAGQRVAPPGGTAGRLGTNPLCVGVPTESDPVVLDFGTSVVAEGKVRVHYISGRPVPDGWLIDHRGEPTNDPKVLYEAPLGGIRPMGGEQSYKGFGLALVLDMLAGGLGGGHMSYPGAPPAKGNSLLFILFDPEKFAGRDALVGQGTKLVEFVKGAPRAEGVAEITLPGDPERRTLERRSTQGIPLEDAHWSKLADLARELGVDVPEVSFKTGPQAQA